MTLGDVDKAEESARRLIQLSPNMAQSHLPLAAILEVRKDRAGAEAELLKGVTLEPANPRMGVAGRIPDAQPGSGQGPGHLRERAGLRAH